MSTSTHAEAAEGERRPMILLVDDQADVRFMLSLFLDDACALLDGETGPVAFPTAKGSGAASASWSRTPSRRWRWSAART